MNGDGHMDNEANQGQERCKWCPHLKEWCTEEIMKRCAFGVQMKVHTRQVVVCAYIAMVFILEEINRKTALPPTKGIIIPGLLRG